MKKEVRQLLIERNSDIRTAMERLNKLGRHASHNTLLVVDDDGKLVGSLNDGDIRRAFLKGASMDSTVGEACKSNPIVAPMGMPDRSMRQLLELNKIDLLPVVDGETHLVGVKRRGRPRGDRKKGPLALIMAGGEGRRLRPLTEKTPKPMLQVGGKPILETIIESLVKAGFGKTIINIRYHGDQITSYFGDGKDFNMEIEYVEEQKPMGTAGSLGLIDRRSVPRSPFLVINGDLLTTLNFKSFRDFHIAAKFDFTLCGRPYKVQIPFGYPVIDGDRVTEFREKPEFTHLVNSGIYCLSPEVIEYVPANEYFDMPDLIRRVLESKKRVGVFPLAEEFHEIGRPESYSVAEEFYQRYLSEGMKAT